MRWHGYFLIRKDHGFDPEFEHASTLVWGICPLFRPHKIMI
jgi:hypothetical protein